MSRFVTFDKLICRLAIMYPNFEKLEIAVHYDAQNPYKDFNKQYCFTIDICNLTDAEGRVLDITLPEQYVAITHRYCRYNPANINFITSKNKTKSFTDANTKKLVYYYEPRCF
jgi:hypothetical protein